MIFEAVTHLKKGGLVAFPTETVYGLGADARNPAAVAEIFRIKERPADVPLTVHLGSQLDPNLWAFVSPEAAKVMDAFWPGPITLILPKTPTVPDIVVAGGPTVGLRMPSHPLCDEFLNTFGGGVAAPSANRHRGLSPTSAEHVREEFGTSLPYILDGGPCQVGLESTVLWMAGGPPRILRHGAITTDKIEACLGIALSPTALPGRSYRLSPNICLAERDTWSEHLANHERVAIICIRPLDGLDVAWFQMPDDPASYQKQLFSTLRALDKDEYDLVLVEPVPSDSTWDAIRNRLNRTT